jgi:hypothetical protein
MKTENKQPDFIPGFDAVAESRRWKEAVAQETAGMTSAERVAYFNDFAEKYFAERRERERTQELAAH